MLPSCKQVSELASENIDEPVRGVRWFKMKLHLLICAYCRRYGEQIELSSQTIKSMSSETLPNEAVRKTVEKCYKEVICNKDKAE